MKDVVSIAYFASQPMQKLDSTVVLPNLSQAEQVAQNLGSVRFEGWQCFNCHPHLTGSGIHIRGYITVFNRFSNCPTCQELIPISKKNATHQLTVGAWHCHAPTHVSVADINEIGITVESSDRILQSATTHTQGIRQVTQRCHCCSYYWETEETIPCVSPPSVSTSTSDSGSSYSSDCSSSSDFGGGSSGGGGGGGDW